MTICAGLREISEHFHANWYIVVKLWAPRPTTLALLSTANSTCTSHPTEKKILHVCLPTFVLGNPLYGVLYTQPITLSKRLPTSMKWWRTTEACQGGWWRRTLHFICQLERHHHYSGRPKLQLYTAIASIINIQVSRNSFQHD